GGLCDHLTHHPQLHPGSVPKPSHNGSASYFWLQTRHSLSRNQTQTPPTYVTSNAPPQHLPVLIYNTDFNDVPKTEPQQAGFGLLAQNLPPPLAHSNRWPHGRRNLIRGTLP